MLFAIQCATKPIIRKQNMDKQYLDYSALNLVNDSLNQNPTNLIKALLLARGLRQKDIALKHEIPASDLNRVIMGIRRTRHIRLVIAAELNVDVRTLWPEEGEA